MSTQFLRTSVATICLGALFGTAAAQAQQVPSPGYGPGMMGGPGPGMGAGMMGAYGPASGYGMGCPGMMGGHGPGYGMMGGYGPGYGTGPGMMGGWSGLNLSDAQTAQMDKIHDSLQEKHRKLMSEMWNEQATMAKLYSAERRDPAAIGKAHDRLSRLQREALEARIEAENKIDDVLTKEQKSQFRRGHGWGLMGY